MDEQDARRQAIEEQTNKLARKWKWQDKGKLRSPGTNTKLFSKNKGYKPLALEMGLKLSAAHPSLYESEASPGLLFNSQGAMTDAPACGACNDAGYTNERPRSRPSRGAWDSELVTCQCFEPPAETGTA